MSAELLGIPHPWEWKGKALKLCVRDLHVESHFCMWVASEAALELARLKPRVPADFYAEQMRAYSAKVCGRQFSWGAEDVHNAYWTEGGQRQMLWLKFMRGVEKGGMRIERADIDEMAKDAESWQRLLDLMWSTDDPAFFAREQERRKERDQTSSPPDNPRPPAGA